MVRAPGRPARAALAVLAGFLLQPALHAQTTGAIRGVVLDMSGAPLPGVVVGVSSQSQAVAGRGAVTDAAGQFQVPSLPAGRDYVVRATLPGYATVGLSEVEVEEGQAAAVRITLQPETTFRERVEVRARPQVVSVQDTTTQTRFTSEFIDSLPLLGRNYQDLLALAPGVTDVDGDGNPNIHGARDTDVITLVDGVSTTDPLTGKVGAQLNIDSIQEIEIKTSGATAEYSRAQGGFANIVTKSGGNEFQGTFKFFWRGSRLDGDGAGIDDPRLHAGTGEIGLRQLRFNDYLPFLSLSGPISRDRAWFFMAHEYVRTEEPVNALSAAFVTGVREFREFVKVTWQPAPNHRLALSLNYDPQSFLNQGINSLTREESGFTQRQGGPVLTLKGTSVLTPLVSLETSLSYLDERPARVPTLDPDTNGNGVLFFDRNQNGFIEASERDPGEDYDGDGHFDVFEDANHNHQLDPDEDLDHDLRLTSPVGCEGVHREDLDCDGHLDIINEDRNGNGRLDPGEDVDGDNHLDTVNEDRNGDGRLDDDPFPQTLYPYGELRPVPPDREYSIDQRSRITSGPYYQDLSDARSRFTIRQDLTLYVPDYWGSHDLKFGAILEREDFSRRTESRPILAPLPPVSRRSGPGILRALLPAASEVSNSATGQTGGLYLQDNYRPFPNLSVGIGLRFDREFVDTFGYSFFDPARERHQFDLLMDLAGNERNMNDATEGDNNGVVNEGILADPIFGGASPSDYGAGQILASYLVPLRTAAYRRLTRPHLDTNFTLGPLSKLFPEIINSDDSVNLEALAALGISPQQREEFGLTNNNLSPRLSISWDPFSNGRTKVFATWGRYYDKLFLSTVVGEEGPDFINRYYFLDPGGVTGNGTPDHGVGAPRSFSAPTTNQVDRNLATPFSDELTFGFEREIAPEVALSVTYVNRRFRRQLQDIDVNHTLRPDPATGLPRDDFGTGVGREPDGLPDLYIHDFFFNQVLRVGNYNQARYHGIELQLTRRLSRRWEAQGSYTYSRAVGSAEDFQSLLGNDPSTVMSEFGYLDYDQRHVVKLNSVLFLPKDWQAGFSVGWSSGLPYSIVTRDFSLDNVDFLQYRTLYGVTEKIPGVGVRFQSMRRNSFRNAATYNIDLNARRSFVIGRRTGSIFVEVFNLLNSDDLRIFTYEPTKQVLFDPNNLAAGTPLQLDAQRRFGRRFQIGFQIDF
jgi:hypothetical protein